MSKDRGITRTEIGEILGTTHAQTVARFLSEHEIKAFPRGSDGSGWRFGMSGRGSAEFPFSEVSVAVARRAARKIAEGTSSLLKMGMCPVCLAQLRPFGGPSSDGTQEVDCGACGYATAVETEGYWGAK